MQKTISEFTLSKMNLKFIKFSIMGSRPEFKKSELESYNKINTIIKSLQNIFTLIKWISTYNANKHVFEFIFINQNYVLTYMKSKQTMNSLFVEKLSESKISFFFKQNVGFKTQYVVKFKKHIENYVIYNEYKMPIDIEFDVDLNLYSNVVMFKNWLRRKLNFQILKINFFTVILMIIKKNDFNFISIQNKIMYDLHNSDVIVIWTNIQKFVINSTLMNFTILYILHALNSKNDVIYKFNEFNFVLFNKLKMRDDDIEIRQKKTLQTSKNATSEIKIDIIQKLLHDSIVKNEISEWNTQLHQFLIFGGFTGRNTLLTSQNLFDTKQQFQSMWYHDGHDVFISNGLYNWQQWILKKINDITSFHEQKNLIKKKTNQKIKNPVEFYKIQQLFMKHKFQTDFSILFCKTLLNMKTMNKYDKIKILNVSESNVFIKCKIRFFNNQINTIEFII